MRAVIYPSRADAETMQGNIDRMHGLPRVHAEGTGPDDYRIVNPGAAAERIRARGVRTTHHAEIVAHPDGALFAVPFEDPRATELDESWAPRPRT